MLPAPLATAQVEKPPTVAQPPRIVCWPPAKLAFAVVVMMPLFDASVPLGSVKSTVPPVLRAMAFSVTLTLSLFAPPVLATIADSPGLTVIAAEGLIRVGAGDVGSLNLQRPAAQNERPGPNVLIENQTGFAGADGRVVELQRAALTAV